MGELWATGLNRLGDWNPQAFREVKGRLTSRNVGLVVGAALLLQILLLLGFALMLPDAEGTRVFNQYCLPENPNGWLCQEPIQIRWDLWWRHIAVTLSWLLPYAIAVPSAAFIAGNLTQEVQRGTLNMLRLSPQRPQALLQGKLWGVPAPIWLGGLTVLPLYLWACWQGGISPLFLLSYGITWGLAIAIFNHGAALMSLNLENQTEKMNPQAGTGMAIGTAAVVWTIGVPVISFLGLATVWGSRGVLTPPWASDLVWFDLPIGQNPWLGHLWLWGWLGWCGRNLHQAAVARMADPLTPVPTKAGSYFLTVALTLLLLGFLRPHPNTIVLFHWLGGAATFFMATGWLQKRQILLDWWRYRHLHSDRQPLIRDLLVGERSPWTLCIAVNILLFAGLWGIWVAVREPQALPATLGMSLSLTVSAIAWNALMQTLQLWARRPRQGIQMTILGLFLLGLPGLVVFGTWPLRTVLWPLWLALGHAWVWLLPETGSGAVWGSVVGLLGQSLVAAGILNWSLHTWQRQGASEWQRLTARETQPALSTNVPDPREKHHAG